MNIALIGMPGSGKTSLGEELARRLSFKFVDIDRFIEKEERKTINEIFREKGEEYFRNKESEIIKKLENKDRFIISTGGGSILREENVKSLKKNSYIIYINRDMDFLKMKKHKKTRPLLRKPGSVERIYKERKGLYEKYADYILSPQNSIFLTAKNLISDLRSRRIIK